MTDVFTLDEFIAWLQPIVATRSLSLTEPRA